MSLDTGEHCTVGGCGHHTCKEPGAAGAIWELLLFIYLVMYGRSRALRHPWGRAGAIPSSPKELPLALAKCSTHHFWFPVSTLYSYFPHGTYFTDLVHKMREIFLPRSVSRREHGRGRAPGGVGSCLQNPLSSSLAHTELRPGLLAAQGSLCSVCCSLVLL